MSKEKFMKKLVLVLSCLCFICSSAVFAESGRYIVTFKSHPTKIAGKPAMLKAMKADALHTAKLLKPFVKKADTQSVLWIINGVAMNLTDEDIAKIRKMPGFNYIEKVKTLTLPKPVSSKAVTPTEAIQWGVKKIGADRVWNELNIDGSGIVVGQLDSGVTPSHPALQGQIIKFKDFIGDGSENDGIGHGTHTAGTMVGDKNGIGVAPGAKLIAGKIFNNSGSTTSEAIAKGMQWIMDPDGNPNTDDAPMVVNNSWGSNDSTSRSFWDEVNAWKKAGIVPVFSAGNNGYANGRVGTPAAYPQSFAIAATTNYDSRAGYSSTGPVTWDGKTIIKPDVAAPGSNIISASNTSDGYVSKSGTSMASPHITGAIALLLQANPQLTNDQIEKILEETAVDLGSAGKDNDFGFGRINIYAAVKKAIKLSDPVKVIEATNKIIANERNYGVDERVAPLSNKYVTSLVKRYSHLSDSQYLDMSIRIMKNGSPLAKKILAQIASTRQFNKLYTNK